MFCLYYIVYSQFIKYNKKNRVLYTHELACLHKISAADILCLEPQTSLHISFFFFFLFISWSSQLCDDFSSAGDMKIYFKMPSFSKALQHVFAFNHINGSLEGLRTYVLE